MALTKSPTRPSTPASTAPRTAPASQQEEADDRRRPSTGWRASRPETPAHHRPERKWILRRTGSPVFVWRKPDDSWRTWAYEIARAQDERGLRRVTLTFTLLCRDNRSMRFAPTTGRPWST